jgi:hypothetical protein
MTALLLDIHRERITLAPLARLVGSTELPLCAGAMCLHSADYIVLPTLCHWGADCAPEKAFANKKASQPERLRNQKGFATKKNIAILWEDSMRRMKKASYSVVVACLFLAAAGSLRPAGSQPASSVAPRSLSYEFFKEKVEPVFLAKRAGHTRCVVCHTINNAPFHLVPLSPGAETWNDEQSRQNFELVQRVAAPGLLESPLLKHPLAQEEIGRASCRERV